MHEHSPEEQALLDRRKVLVHPDEQPALAEAAKAAGLTMIPEPTPEALALAKRLVSSGGVSVRRSGPAPRAKPEHGIGHLDSRSAGLLHYPCVSLAMTYTSRYVERRGDLILRTYVIRYAHLFGGFPLWHSAGVVLDAAGQPKLRAEWTRRDRRQMQQMLDRRLEHVGEGPTLEGEVAGMFTEYADHRLRPLSGAEARHYPADLLTKHEPIDLWAEPEEGEESDASVARSADGAAAERGAEAPAVP